MPGLEARYEWVDKNNLSEAITKYDGGFILSGSELKGVNEQGEPKTIRGLGLILIEAFEELGLVKRIDVADAGRPGDEIAMLVSLLQEENRRLQQEKDELQRKYDQELGQLRQDIDKLTARLTRYEEGVEGFCIGDRVGWATEEGINGSYDTGYIVAGFTDDGKINLKDTETGDIAFEVNPSDLAHENELEPDESGLSEFDRDDEVGIKEGEKYRVGYHVIIVDKDSGEIIVENNEGKLERYSEDRLAPRDEIDAKDILDDEPKQEFKEGDEVGWKRGEKYIGGYLVDEIKGSGEEQQIYLKKKGSDSDVRPIVKADQVKHIDDIDEKDLIKEDNPKYEPGDKVGVRGPNGFIKGFEVIEVGEPDANGKRKAKIQRPNEEPREVDEDVLKPETEITDDETAPVGMPPARTERTGLRGRLSRWSEGFGGFLLGRQARLHNNVYNIVSRGDRRVVTEEEYYETRDANRRAGIGGVALVAAGVVLAGIADLIEDYFEKKHSIYVPKITNPETPSPIVHSPIIGHGWEVIPPKGVIPANETIHFYNGAQGSHAFAYAAPSNYEWSGHAGNYSFTGPNGITVDHLQWKNNGATSDGTLIRTFTAETKRRLLKAFPELKIKLGQLFYSDHSGPGRHGWIKHYIPYLLPKK